MGRLGGLNWKEFYRREREENSGRIGELIEEYLRSPGDEVDEVIEKGGALSFPHTYIQSSIEPVIRTVSSIHRSGRTRVMALGVMHQVSGLDPEKEFSLDAFLWVEKVMRENFDTPKIDIHCHYLPTRSYGDRLLFDAEDDMSRFAEDLKSEIDEDTCIVLTGDLTHYGEFYGTSPIVEDPQKLILSWCENDLDDLYLKGDIPSYLRSVRIRLNDQWAPAIVVKKLLGDDLVLRIFKESLSDYSYVLDAKTPTYVASIFYGVYPLH